MQRQRVTRADPRTALPGFLALGKITPARLHGISLGLKLADQVRWVQRVSHKQRSPDQLELLDFVGRQGWADQESVNPAFTLPTRVSNCVCVHQSSLTQHA